MHSTVFSVSIIIISCLPIYSQCMGDNRTQIGNNGKRCTFPTLAVPDATKMPIIFSYDHQNPAVLYPDKNGNLSFKSGTSFMLSCVSGTFNVFKAEKINEIRVMCNDKQLLQYGRDEFKYTDLICDRKLKSTLKLTNTRCQPDKSEKSFVATVGFQTKNHFLVLYSVCFDKTSKNSLYTWYNVRNPYFNNQQNCQGLEFKTGDPHLYGQIGMQNLYKTETQKETVNTILQLEPSSEKFISSNPRSNQYMSRGHYVAKTDFFYAYEQEATYYFANAAPQWQSFNNGKWTMVENIIRNELEKNNWHRRVVITGTFGPCTLPDRNGFQTPLYLVMPAKHIAVPLFYWKMLYDADDGRNNIVYIGLNNPYAKIQDVNHLLPCDRIPCPGTFDYKDILSSPSANEGLVFCCWKYSFEGVYGKLDPIVFNVNRN